MVLSDIRRENLGWILESLKDVRDISDPDERLRVREEVAALLNGREPWPVELEGQHVFYIHDFIERGFYQDARGNRRTR